LRVVGIFAQKRLAALCSTLEGEGQRAVLAVDNNNPQQLPMILIKDHPLVSFSRSKRAVFIV